MGAAVSTETEELASALWGPTEFNPASGQRVLLAASELTPTRTALLRHLRSPIFMAVVNVKRRETGLDGTHSGKLRGKAP